MIASVDLSPSLLGAPSRQIAEAIGWAVAKTDNRVIAYDAGGPE
jgi:hypothetical protein